MEDMLIYQKAQKIVCTLFRERFYFSFKNGDRQVKLQMGPLLFYLQKTDLTFTSHCTDRRRQKLLVNCTGKVHGIVREETVGLHW